MKMTTIIGSQIFFFFNDTATTEIYTLSLHDALPIYRLHVTPRIPQPRACVRSQPARARNVESRRSEEHTSELQSQSNLVCRLLLEKKKKTQSHSVDRYTTKETRTEPHSQNSYRSHCN